jgi:uncharacterized protein YuzE
MAAKLTLKYDKVGDILYIDKCPPYKEQESEELGDEIAVRLNPRTGAIENLEILFFSKRLEAGETIELPFAADIRLIS